MFSSHHQTKIIKTFTLASEIILNNVPVAFMTWGTLSENKDNVILICHALTGSADVSDWWADMMTSKNSFLNKNSKNFIICFNCPGSPYGSISPLSINSATGLPYQADFPLFTVRDTVRLFKLVLDILGIRKIKTLVGGSMGGFIALEWTIIYNAFVKSLILLATCAKQSAWTIAISESQRQSIYMDPLYNNGFYEQDNRPNQGLAVARMQAMLSYRSKESFDKRFGREKMNNDDIFMSQSYMKYQGEKFVKRFDPNCYISLTKMLDTHDIYRDRPQNFLTKISQPVLIIGITSDILYTIEDQAEIHNALKNSKFVQIKSDKGHDGFLLEIDEINKHVGEWIEENDI